MLKRDERDHLLVAFMKIYAKGADGEIDPEWLHDVRSQPRGAFAEILGAEEEELVKAVVAALAKIAGLVARPDGEGTLPPVSAVLGPLGGAELVMRGEIIAGNVDHLPGLLPGFAFLVTLPLIGEEEALRLSREAAELVDGAK